MAGDASSIWAAVQAEYARGALTVAQICARYGITSKALYRQAKKEGWPLRSAANTAASRSAPKPSGRRGSRKSRKALIARLYKALEHKMTEFESRLADGAQTATESERDARTLNTMVRLFERLGALEEKAKAGDAASRDDGELGADARALREDLARRLERLRAERGA